MCGIYAYIGKNAYEKVVNGLKMVEYRGYDSCGIAYYENGFQINKALGSISNLKLIKTKSTLAFGHTRWATNGVVNVNNAHPHQSYDKKLTIVHNGIVTNSNLLKEELEKQGITFSSTTDTEVVVNYIAYKSEKQNLEDVLKDLYNVLEGSFSFVLATENGDLYLLKRLNPLNILVHNKEVCISSDLASLNNGKLYSLKDNDIIKIRKNTLTNLNGEKIEYIKHNNTYLAKDLQGYKHYMEKEIFETPMAIKNTYNEIKNLETLNLFNNYDKLTLIGCGTAYHACLIGEHLFKNELNKQVDSCLASNYIVNKPIEENHLHIIVSQSGETADCIKVAEQIKEHNGKFMVITNEKQSLLAQMANYCVFTKADREIAVASTKTYCSQVFVFAFLCHKLKNPSYELDIDRFTQDLTEFIKSINIDEYAHILHEYDKLIMIAKNIDYLTIYEACLKIREVDYIFTLPMYSGELKHGTLALVDNKSVVCVLNTSKDKKLLDLAINSIKSREGKVLDISHLIKDEIDSYYKPIYTIIPFQLIAYKIAILNNLNPDRPRNLAKSVTVE